MEYRLLFDTAHQTVRFRTLSFNLFAEMLIGKGFAIWHSH